MPKYDSRRKPDRDKAIVNFARNNPLFSYKEIGEMFGVTKGRVCQICRKAGLERR